MKRYLLSFLLLLLCISVTIMIVSPQSVIERFRRFFKPTDELTPHYHQMVAFHSCMDGSVPEGSVIFIGDSLTQGLCVAAVACPSVNYGIGGDTSYGVLQRIPRYESIRNAKVVVIAIGINDFKFRSDVEFLSNYRAILRSIPNDTLVVISSILPITVEAEGVGRSMNRIIAVNQELAWLAAENKKVYFCDAGKAMVDPAGYLRSKLHGGDGVHLNTEGYVIWIEALKMTMSNIK